MEKNIRTRMGAGGLILPFLLVAAPLALVAQSRKPLFPEKPGLVSYTFRKTLARDMPAALDSIKGYGITDMEFSNLFGKTAAAVRSLIDERGIHCSSYGVSYEDLLNKTDVVAKDAITLGAHYVRVAWIPHQGAFTPDNAKKLVDTLNFVGEYLKEKYGLGFIYHNHGYEFEKYQDGTLYDYIMQHTDPAYVSFELDILWAFLPGQDPAALLNKYGSRYKCLHLKDLRKGVATGDLSGHTPVTNDVALGTGQIDIPAILRAAKKAGVEHYYIEDESDRVAEQVPQSIAYLAGL